MLSGSSRIENRMFRQLLTAWIPDGLEDADITQINNEIAKITLNPSVNKSRTDFQTFLQNFLQSKVAAGQYAAIQLALSNNIEKIFRELLITNTLNELNATVLREKPGASLNKLKQLLGQREPTIFLREAILNAYQSADAGHRSIHFLMVVIDGLKNQNADESDLITQFKKFGIDDAILNEPANHFATLMSDVFLENQINKFNLKDTVSALQESLLNAAKTAIGYGSWFGGGMKREVANEQFGSILGYINELPAYASAQAVVLNTVVARDNYLARGVRAITQAITALNNKDMTALAAANANLQQVYGNTVQKSDVPLEEFLKQGTEAFTINVKSSEHEVLQKRYDAYSHIWRDIKTDFENPAIQPDKKILLNEETNILEQDVQQKITDIIHTYDLKSAPVAVRNVLKQYETLLVTIREERYPLIQQEWKNALQNLQTATSVTSKEIAIARIKSAAVIVKAITDFYQIVLASDNQPALKAVKNKYDALGAEISNKIHFMNAAVADPNSVGQILVGQLDNGADKKLKEAAIDLVLSLVDSRFDSIASTEKKKEFFDNIKLSFPTINFGTNKISLARQFEILKANKDILLNTTPAITGNTWLPIIADLLRAPFSKAGNAFFTILPAVTQADPQPQELRQVFESNLMGISEALYATGKSGGKNLAGEFGGNYLQFYQTPDNQIHKKLVFYKQPTDDNQPNNQEGIAEVYGGRSLNHISPDLSAPIYCTVAPGGKFGVAKDVYIGSVYHNDFQDLYKAGSRAFANDWNKNVEERNAKNPVQFRNYMAGISKIYLDGEYKGVTLNPAQIKTLRMSLGEAMMGSLLVGNEQIHAQNLGIAKVNNELLTVSLDYGGAGRRTYKTAKFLVVPYSTAPVKVGRFARHTNPEDDSSKKWGSSYFGQYDEKLRSNKDVITGYDVIANFDRAKLIASQVAEVQYDIEKYGAEAYAKSFAAELIKLDPALTPPPYLAALSDGSNPAALAKAATEFLVDAILARQLSIKEYSLSRKFNHPDFDQGQLFRDNPFYALREKKMTETDFKTNLQDANPERQKIIDVLENDFIAMKFAATPSPVQVKHAAQVSYYRLLSLSDFLANNQAQWTGNIDAYTKLNTNLKISLDFLKKALEPGFYDFTKEGDDTKVITQACDEAFCQIRNTYFLLLRDNPRLAASFLNEQARLGSPDPKNNSFINYVNYMEQQIFPRVKLVADPVMGGIAADDDDDELELKSDPAIDPVNSGSASFTPPPFGSLTLPKPSSSPSSMGMFGHSSNKASIENVLFTYVEKVANYFSHDQAVRDSLTTFANQRMGVSATPAEQIRLDKINNLVAKFQTDSMIDFNMSNTVMRTPQMDAATFDPNTYFASVDTKAKLVTQTMPLADNKVVVNYIVSNQAVQPDKNNFACFVESRINNKYQIDVISVSSSLSKINMIDAVLGPNVSNQVKEKLRDIYFHYDQISHLVVDQASYDQNAAEWEQAIKALSQSSGTTEQELYDATNAVKKRDMQAVPGSGVSIVSDEYLKQADIEIQAFLANAGSNKMVRIKPTNDPMRAYAYMLIATAHGLKCKPTKPLYNFIANVQDATVQNFITDKMNAGILSKPSNTREATAVFVKDLWNAVKDKPEIENDTKQKIKEFSDKMNSGKFVSAKEVVEAANEARNQIKAAVILPPSPSAI